MAAKLHKLLPGLNHTLLTVDEGIKNGLGTPGKTTRNAGSIRHEFAVEPRMHSSGTPSGGILTGPQTALDISIHKLHPPNENSALLRALQEHPLKPIRAPGCSHHG
jgi:hypothetical protein